MFDLFNKKKLCLRTRQLQEVEADLDDFMKANKQLADGYGVMRDAKIKLENANESLKESNVALKAEAIDRDAQIEALREETEGTGDRIAQLEDEVNELEDERDCLLNDYQARINHLGKENAVLHDRITKTNNMIDSAHEWIGEWAKRMAPGINKLVEGWSCPDGRYPWEEEE